MPARVLLLSVALTCSALRIQQKEKDVAAIDPCASKTDCECWLIGGMTGNIGSCTPQDQAKAVIQLGQQIAKCTSDFSCSWYYGDCSGNTPTISKKFELVNCLVNNPASAADGVMIASGALLNPTGLIPKEYADPAEQAAIEAQYSLLTLAKQADNPGSPPFGLCLGAAMSSTTTFVTICDTTTNMFDGLGMCCSNFHNSASRPTDLQTTSMTNNRANWASCKTASGATTSLTRTIHFNDGTSASPLDAAFCYKNVKYHKCVIKVNAIYPDCPGTQRECYNGGFGTKMGKYVKICSA